MQSRPLRQLVQQIKINKSINGLREDYNSIVDRMLRISKLDKLDSDNLDNDENLKNLLAKIEKIKKMMDSSAHSTLNAEQTEAFASAIFDLDETLSQQTTSIITKLLLNELYAYNSTFGNLATTTNDLNQQTALGHYQFILKNFCSLTEQQLQSLQEKGILNEHDFISSDPLDLAQSTGVPINTIMELMNFFKDYCQIKENLEVSQKVLDLHKSNRQLMSEVEKLTLQNNVSIENNKNLRHKYNQIHPIHAKLIAEMKALQSTVTASQIECNRLAMEINFLKDERYQLSLVAEEKHLILGKLLKRIDSIKKNHDFIKGETTFSEDMLVNLELLLGDALSCGKIFGEKLEETKTSLETLFSELDGTIKKGKLIFYKELKQT